MIQKFLKDSVLYTLANLFTKGIGFVMLPVYLSYMDKTEYGTYDYIFTIGSFISVIVALEIAQSVLRFASEVKSNKKKSSYIANGVFFTAFAYLLFFLFGVVFIDELSELITGKSDQHTIIVLALISYGATAMLYMSSVVFRSNLDSKSATLSSAISAALVASFSVIGLKLYDQPLVVILTSTIIGQLIVAIYNYWKLRDYWFHKLNFPTLRKMLLFSAPLVISSIGVMLSTLVDRMVIKDILGFTALAEYGVAARFASIVTLLTLGFQSALSPIIYSQVDNPSTKRSIRKLFYLYALISLLAVIILCFTSEELMTLITSESYRDSASIFVLLACAILIQSGYVFFPGLSIAKKTSELAIINVILGFANFLGNIYLVPIYGISGAAYSTLSCAVLFFWVNLVFSEKYYPNFVLSDFFSNRNKRDFKL